MVFLIFSHFNQQSIKIKRMKNKLEQLKTLIDRGELISATLSSPHTIEKGVSKITVAPVFLKGALHYQLSEHVGNKVLHINMRVKDFLNWLEINLPRFKQGDFRGNEDHFHLLQNRKKELTVLQKRKTIATPVQLPLHNRQKKYLLEEGAPIPFLIEQNVMSKEGKVYPKMYDKFKQINRFLEMVSDVMGHFRETKKTINIVDFGSGKAYLTFALYHYLTHILKRDVKILGIDLKEDVVSSCNLLAKKLQFNDLSFVYGDIEKFFPREKIDMMIALHACDIATDLALKKAVEKGVEVILAVPCCQKELLKQIKCEPLDSLLRHGILRERFSSLVTDAARADLLEKAGYTVQVLEFIDMEHTPKNLLIRAFKGSSNQKIEAAKNRYSQFKSHLKINPSLEGWL